MYKFSKLSLRFLSVNKIRVTLSVLGISMAICMILSMFSIFEKMEQNQVEQTKTLFGIHDVTVGYGMGQFMAQEEIDKIKNAGNIDSISKVMINPFINNKAQKAPSTVNLDIYMIGAENDQLSKSKYNFNKNIDHGSVVLSETLANTLHAQVNGQVTLELPNVGIRSFNVKEVIPTAYGSTVPYIAVFNLENLQQIYHLKDQYSYMMIKLNNPDEAVQKRSEIQAINKSFKVDLIQKSEDVERNIKGIKTVGYGIGILAVIVSIFFIVSNFRMFVNEHYKELVIIRSIGGTLSQCLRILIEQVLFIVTAGAVLGIGFTYVLNSYLIQNLAQYFKISNSDYTFEWTQNIIITLLISFLIFVVLSLWIYFSMNIAPMEAMRQNRKLDYNERNTRFPTISLSIAAFCLLVSFIAQVTSNAIIIFPIISAVFFIIALYKFFVIHIQKILLKLLPLCRFIGGTESFVAIKNIIPQTKSNTLIILMLSGALMIGIPVMNVIQTIKQNSINNIHSEYISDIVVTSANDRLLGPKSELLQKMKNIPGVEDIFYYSDPQGISIINDANSSNPQDKEMGIVFTDLQLLSNRRLLPSINDDTKNVIVLSKDQAEKLKAAVGDRVTVKARIGRNEYKTVSVKVGAVAADLPGILSSEIGLMDWKSTDLYTEEIRIDRVFVPCQKEKVAMVQSVLKSLEQNYVGMRSSTLQQALIENNNLLNQRVFLFIIIIVDIAIIGIVGLVLTIGSHIQSQRREYAILRAMSLTPNQITKVVASQTLLFCCVGIVMGVVSGVIMTLALALALRTMIQINLLIILYISVCMIGLSMILSLPVAKRITKNPIREELKAVQNL